MSAKPDFLATRRKSHAAVASLNGDDDDKRRRLPVNMVAAMHDHLSCTKSETKASMPYELDHMYANCGGGRGDDDDDSRPMRCIRELLLSHLDLVLQQQEQLGLKDRQLAAARQENSNLKQQLEDTQRRLSALEREHEKLKRFKTSTELGFLSCNRYRDLSVYSRGGGNNNRSRNRSSNSLESPSTKRSRGSGTGMHLDRFRLQKTADGGGGTRTVVAQSNGLAPVPVLRRDHSLLQTGVMYYTAVGEAPCTSVSPRADENVLVPCWRLRTISSCYQMEGTENLDDDIFLKRHQKLEIDEKRRKRWDIQRLREQRLQEKLKRGRGRTKDVLRTRNPELVSFYPRPEDVQYIEVSDTIPVAAFGYPIPFVQPSEFQIPWLEPGSGSWCEMKGHGRTASGSKR